MKPHINHKYSLVIITPRIFSSKMLYFGWWEGSWLNFYDRYDHITHIWFTVLYMYKRIDSNCLEWFYLKLEVKDNLDA
jgi:hypothetical protein